MLSASPILVWDEPYANLDRDGRDWVDGLINAHCAQGGFAVISAHQQPQVDAAMMETLELSA